MKKSKKFALLSIALLWMLTACGEKKEDAKSEASAGNTLSVLAPKSSGDGGFDATGFALKELANTVMVEDKVKAYVDAMKAQEETLQHKYRVSPLDGPEDFGAKEMETDDNHSTYAKEKTGGAYVCQYLNRNDYHGDCPCRPIEVSWTKGNLKYKKATVSFWPKGKEAEKRSVETSGPTAKLENLYRNTEYEYQLSVDASETWKSEAKSFKTADYTRMIHRGAVHNVRDLGGYMTSDGKRTKQGLIYRGYEVMGKRWDSIAPTTPPKSRRSKTKSSVSVMKST